MFNKLFDDAAIFPPGNLALPDAVRAHIASRSTARGQFVGPLVIGLADLSSVAALTTHEREEALPVSVTVPSSQAACQAIDMAKRLTTIRLVGIEVTLSKSENPASTVSLLDAAVADGDDAAIWVEVPRDERCGPLLSNLAGSRYHAKFRTGGVQADMYPGEIELAAAIGAAVRLGVPFKATAGLHHPVRNSDAETGFEQHGFLNVLIATDVALKGADDAQVRSWLSERDGARVAERTRETSPAARAMFRSFGTCSISGPLADLSQLGLLTAGADSWTAYPELQD